MKKIAEVKQPMIGLYHLPVVLVTCCDEEGRPNIIPIGWVGGVCSNPPQVGIAVRPRRFSYKLIERMGQFVVNIPEERLLDVVDKTGFSSGGKVDKFEKFGLTPLPASKVKPPLIEECSVNLECLVRHALNLGSHTFFVGEIVAVHADEEILKENGEIDYTRLKPIVLKHDEYCGMTLPLGWYGFTKYKKRVVNEVY
ncbi:MAG: Flavoredoxin [Syntrophorhabdus sp. PtaU1.Bin153]|nr:MAG: Flavoredoxin [Syntrophorhabdus sp. PtaU1.Bin153]